MDPIVKYGSICGQILLAHRTKSLGTPVILDEAEMTMMKERFKNYGQRVSLEVDIL